MSQENNLKLLESEFSKLQKELNLKVTLNELDEIFFIRDYILQSRFVSTNLSRMVCGRIRDTFNLWIGQLHSWIMPNPSSMIAASESKIFEDDEKEEIIHIMKEYMAFVSQNVVIGLTKAKKREAEYISSSIEVWKDNLASIVKFTKKVEAYWKKEKQDSLEKKKK